MHLHAWKMENVKKYKSKEAAGLDPTAFFLLIVDSAVMNFLSGYQ